LSQTHCKQRI